MKTRFQVFKHPELPNQAVRIEIDGYSEDGEWYGLHVDVMHDSDLVKFAKNILDAKDYLNSEFASYMGG